MYPYFTCTIVHVPTFSALLVHLKPGGNWLQSERFGLIKAHLLLKKILCTFFGRGLNKLVNRVLQKLTNAVEIQCV